LVIAAISSIRVNPARAGRETLTLVAALVATVGAFPTVGFVPIIRFCRRHEPTVRKALTVPTCFFFSPFELLRPLRAFAWLTWLASRFVPSGAVEPILLYHPG